MKNLIPLFLILLSGCTTAPKHTYQSQTNTDPVFVFGDRFGGGAVDKRTKGAELELFLQTELLGQSLS